MTIFALLAAGVCADIYLHNPRGSNDRNCERNANRNNGNRLFDSQNNAKGGYACPRAVGDESMQSEEGVASRGSISQNKKMYYYEGSVLPIEWTNQHGCGNNSKVNCEIVIQYMCEDTADPSVDDFWPYTTAKNDVKARGRQAYRNGGDRVASPRDGVPSDSVDAATERIPDDFASAIPDTKATRRYGMHESFGHYELCQHTERNKGLYTADQRVRRNDMRATRQNPNGDRRGLECPEERDYYPHWMPSPWIDVAVLTNDAQAGVACRDPSDPNCSPRCRYYLENSFNVNTKSYCDVAHGTQSSDEKFLSDDWTKRRWHNNQEACEAAGFVWYNISLSDLYDEMTYPVCAETQFARVNHLGNAADEAIESDSTQPTQGHNANRYLWTVPDIPDTITSEYASCTLRIRYNISTSDFSSWPSESLPDGHDWGDEFVTSANNSRFQGDPNTPLKQDPYVYIGAGDDSENDMFVSLAVNTNQYSRTFQDRTFSFTIRKRPTETTETDPVTDTPAVTQSLIDALDPSSESAVYNVNVRGKRGNIVQTYPAVEYDFTPNSLALKKGDVVHFQWTGSDYNPRRGCNDAEGGPPDPNDFKTAANAGQNSRADRSNLIFLNSMAENVPMDMAGYSQTQRSEDYASRVALSTEAILSHSPCASLDSDPEVQDECVSVVRRLAFLNQDSDGLALSLRDNLDCLTEDELDAIDDKNERENHPLNCAKLNAKPFPYFDAGTLTARVSGYFAFFSSRNNNFSNRDQTGVICVKNDDGSGCGIDPGTGVIQDQNPAIATASRDDSRVDLFAARCFDEANSEDAANAQGASSCIIYFEDAEADVLTEESTAIENKDNDALGDGNAEPCDIIYWDVTSSKSNKTVRYLTLAIIMLFVGIFLTWATIFTYNRCVARKKKLQVFKEGQDWKKKRELEMQ